MARQKVRQKDTRFDRKYNEQFIRLPNRDGWGFWGRRLAREACFICQLPIECALTDAHIHPADVNLSDPPTLDRVFRLCRNHHEMYDCHVITTAEVLAAEDYVIYYMNSQSHSVPSLAFDMLLIEQLHSGKRAVNHAKAKRAWKTRREATRKPTTDNQSPLFSTL